MGKAMRGDPDGGRGRGSPAAGAIDRLGAGPRRVDARIRAALAALLLVLASPFAPSGALHGQDSDLVRLVRGRFTIVSRTGDAQLARSMVERAERNDTFPGLPRPRAAIHI